MTPDEMEALELAALHEVERRPPTRLQAREQAWEDARNELTPVISAVRDRPGQSEALREVLGVFLRTLNQPTPELAWLNMGTELHQVHRIALETFLAARLHR